MKAFWREALLTPDEEALLSLVLDAHYHSTFRQNPSSIACQCAAQGSGSILNAISVAIMSVGGIHGPIEETYRILTTVKVSPESLVKMYLDRGSKIPGWGSSFESGKLDPLWQGVSDWIQMHQSNMHERILGITEALHETGKDIYPNPSAFTAATAIILGMPQRLSPYLLLMGRMTAWAEVYMNETKSL